MKYDWREHRVVEYRQAKKGEWYRFGLGVCEAAMDTMTREYIVVPRPHDAAWAIERMLEGQVIRYPESNGRFRINKGVFETWPDKADTWRTWIPQGFWSRTGFEVYVEPVKNDPWQDLDNATMIPEPIKACLLDLRKKLEAGR